MEEVCTTIDVEPVILTPIKRLSVIFLYSGSDNSRFGGPKLPGGIYAIAHNRHATTLADVKSIAKEVSSAGFIPSVHGDDSSNMLGCGFFKLWLTGRFDDMGYPRPEFDADQGAKAVKDAGGVIEMHHGKHTEKVVYINLCPNTTIEPDENDQRFVVDAWIGGKFNLDIPKFLIGAAATVEMLGGPKVAKIIVPRGQPIIHSDSKVKSLILLSCVILAVLSYFIQRQYVG
jgi:hypothetical protein